MGTKADDILYEFCGDTILNDGKSLFYLGGQEEKIKKAINFALDTNNINFTPLKSFDELPKNVVFIGILAGPQIDLVYYDKSDECFKDYFYKQRIYGLFGYSLLPDATVALIKCKGEFVKQ